MKTSTMTSTPTNVIYGDFSARSREKTRPATKQVYDFPPEVLRTLNIMREIIKASSNAFSILEEQLQWRNDKKE